MHSETVSGAEKVAEIVIQEAFVGIKASLQSTRHAASARM